MAAKVLTDADIEKLEAAPVLTDEDIASIDSPKPERESRISALNPLGLNPVSGVIGSDPRDIGKGAEDTAFGLVEGFTGGLLKPRKFAQEEMGIESNLLGKTVGFMAGPGRIIRGATAPLMGVKFAGPVLRGATEGALGGAAFPADDLDQRISNAKLGAVIGAPLEAAASGIGAAWKGIQKFRQAKKEMKILDNIKTSLKDKNFELAEQKFNIGESQSQSTAKIDGRIKRLKQAEKEILAKQKSAMDEQMKGLSSQLDSEVQSKAQSIKEPTLKYMRDFKDEWGQQFDEILENADTAEQGLKISELKQIEQETIEELTELGIDPKGPAVSTMSRSVNSFKPSTIIKEVDEEVIDAAGMLSKKKVSTEEIVDDLIRNKDLVNVRRNVRRSLSAQAKRGQYTEEDIAQAIFDRKLGEKLSSTLGDNFGQLNEKYKNFSDLSRFAYKNLRPKASEFEIPGKAIIKKVAQGKADIGQKKAVALLEESTGIKFTGKATDIAKQMEDLKNQRPAKLKATQAKFQRRQAELMAKKRQILDGNKKSSSIVKDAKRSIDEKSLSVDKVIRNIDSEIKANKEILDSMGIGKQIARGVAIGTAQGLVSTLLLKSLLGRKD